MPTKSTSAAQGSPVLPRLGGSFWLPSPCYIRLRRPDAAAAQEKDPNFAAFPTFPVVPWLGLSGFSAFFQPLLGVIESYENQMSVFFVCQLKPPTFAVGGLETWAPGDLTSY